MPSSTGGKGILLTEPVSYAGITLAVNTEDANIQNLSDVSGDVYVGQEWFVRETIEAANSNIVMLPFQSYVPDFLEGFKEDGLPFALLDIEGWYLLKKMKISISGYWNLSNMLTAVIRFLMKMCKGQ